MSSLFLSDVLAGWSLSKGEEQTSEVRGGKYAARVQEGYEKDGSPKYRYFKTQDEYDDYLKGAGKKKKSKESKDVRGSKHTDEAGGQERLGKKTAKEQEESRKKQGELFTASKKKKKNVETTTKSLRLYIEVKA